MTDYSVLMLDIKQSRKLNEAQRQSAQDDLLGALNCANALFYDSLEKPLMFSAGDEIQGMFRDLPSAFLAYRYLRILVQTVELRGGIGIGSWTTRTESSLSTEQDGTAYHRARAAIDAAEKDRFKSLKIFDEKGCSNLYEAATASSIGIIERRNKPQKRTCEIVELTCPLIFDLWARKPGQANRYKEAIAQRLANTGLDFQKDIEPRITSMEKPFDAVQVELEKSLMGIPGLLEIATGASRQGIEKSMRNASIQLEREQAALAVYVLSREGAEKC